MAKAKMKNTTSTAAPVTAADVPRYEVLAARGRLWPRRLLAVVLSVLILAVALAVSYVVVMWLAVELVPMLGMLVMTQIGSDPATLQIQTLLLYWVAPFLVLIGLVIWMGVLALRLIWSRTVRLIGAMNYRLIGLRSPFGLAKMPKLPQAGLVASVVDGAGRGGSRLQRVTSESDTNTLSDEEKR